LSDNCSNSDDVQASTNVGGGCSYNDENNDNKGGAFWDKSYHDFYMIPFHASSGYKPHRNGQMTVSPDEFFMLFF
jgi:hypothetical protein